MKKIIYCLGLLLIAKSALATDTPGAYLADMTWPEAEKKFASSPAVIIPFGAGAKEHGRHIPMNADHVVLKYLTDQAVAGADVIVAPAVLYGWLPSFREFPGTEIGDATVFIDYMEEVAKSLIKNGAKRLIFLNTSINRAGGLPLAIVARDIRANRGVPTLLISWDDLETEEAELLLSQEKGGHADEAETSINLFLQADNIDMTKAETDYGDRPAKDYVGYKPGVLARDNADPMYSKTGAFGDPTLATPEKGRLILEIMTQNLMQAIAGFSAEPLPAPDKR
jgi:creatinine amidohydrolase